MNFVCILFLLYPLRTLVCWMKYFYYSTAYNIIFQIIASVCDYTPGYIAVLFKGKRRIGIELAFYYF